MSNLKEFIEVTSIHDGRKASIRAACIDSVVDNERENPHIDYTNQMLIVNPDGRADSWVPSSSDVFAEDWCIIGEEETFLTRLKEEAAELYFRHEKLGEFIGSEKFAAVSDVQQSLLKKQYDAMTEYGKILDERIVDLEK